MYQRLTFRRGTVWSARFAQDGQTIVYGAAWEGQPIRVFTTVPGSPEPRALDLPDADLLAVSSRGELALALDRYRYTYLGYGRGTLATVPLAGGSPRALLEGVNGADWSPDGRELALAIREGRSDSRLEYPQGRVLCRQELPVICPRVSPGADVVAFLERGAVHVVDTGGAKRRLSPLPPRWSNRLAWSPRGDEVWFGGSLRGDEWAIYAVDLQGRTRLVADLPFVGHLLDVSADGRALLTLADERGAMTANAPGTPKEVDLSWLDWSYPLQISRDGRTLLFGEAGQGGSRTQSLYVRPMDGSAPAVRVAEGSNAFDKAALSPDAKWLLVWQPERPAELRLLPSGPGEQTTIRGQGIEFASTELLGLERATFVLSDGRRVVAPGREPGRPWRSWVQDVAGGPARPFTPEGTLAEAISPDGTLAVARDGERRLVLYPVEGGRPRPVPGPPEPGRILEWANDGRALFIEETHDARGLASHILRRDLGTGRRELWREERPGDQAGLSSVRCVISGDGRSYACSQTRMLSSLFLVEGLK
jgi:Tol biopolymer transport system component